MNAHALVANHIPVTHTCGVYSTAESTPVRLDRFKRQALVGIQVVRPAREWPLAEILRRWLQPDQQATELRELESQGSSSATLACSR